MQDDTPPEAVHAVRPTASDHGTVDSVFWWEFRREMRESLREVRKEQQASMREVQVRLTAIESNQRDSVHTAEKHAMQLTELVDLSAELDKRLGEVEAYQLHQVVERVKFLEQAEIMRAKAEYAQQELAEASAKSTTRDLAKTAGQAAIYGVVGGVLLFVWWLVTAYAKATT